MKNNLKIEIIGSGSVTFSYKTIIKQPEIYLTNGSNFLINSSKNLQYVKVPALNETIHFNYSSFPSTEDRNFEGQLHIFADEITLDPGTTLIGDLKLEYTEMHTQLD